MLSKFKSYSKTCVRRENSGKIGKEGRSERRKNKRKKEKGGKIVRKMEKLEEREREKDRVKIREDENNNTFGIKR